MDFFIERKLLHDALSKIAVALENKDEMEAYTHVALRGAGHRIRMTASNRHLDAEAQLEIEGNVGTSQIGVSGALLKKLVASLNEDRIRFRLLKAHVSVEAGRSRMKLPVLSPARFAEVFPGHTDYRSDSVDHGQVNMQALLRALDKVTHCVNENHPRSEYVSVFISPSWFVTTDGHRMALWPNGVFDPGGSILLHMPQVSRIRKVFAGLGEWGGVAMEGDYRIHLACGGIACATRLKAGTFPDFMSVIPKTAGRTLRAKTASLIERLRRVLLVSPKGMMVEIETVDAGGTELRMHAESDLGDAVEHIDCLSDGGLAFRINGKFLLDALQRLEGEDAAIQLYYNREGVPGMVVIQEGDYKNVILPLREREGSGPG